MKKIFFIMQHLIKNLFRLFFSFSNNGNKCIICNRTSFIMPVCYKCKKKYFNVIESLQIPRCSICGKTLISTKDTCLECREEQIIYNIDKMYPLFSYRLWNKELLFLWKSNELRVLSYFFYKIVLEAIKQLKIKYIVPIPPRPNKIKEKGWDQIQEICNLLKYLNGIQILDLLERKNSIQQKKLDRKERLNTIGNSYFLKDKEKISSIINKNGGDIKEVCLLDDVCTTGSTLESCALLLKKFGIQKVYAITLFIVD